MAIRLRPLLLLLVLAALLTACAPVKHPINPPNASIQQLDVLPDGRWQIQIRLENFSDLTVHYGAFKAVLRVGGADVGPIEMNANLDVPGENADIIQTILSPGPDARRAFAADISKPGGAEYEIKGSIEVPAAGKDFRFEHKSRLSAVPGVVNSYR
jgi:hypothetical protein